MRKLNSAWGRLTTRRKVIVVGIAVAAVMMVCLLILNHGKPDEASNNGFIIFCTMFALLMWGLYRLLRPRETLLRITILLVSVSGVALIGFVDFVTELYAATQVRIERNKVRIGMTINDVLPLVHGMDIRARAVLHDNIDDTLLLDNWNDLYGMQCDGTFWCTEGLRLTESQAAELMKQKMSDGHEWRWRYTLLNLGVRPSFTVTFGRDGRVKDITGVYLANYARFHPV